MKALVVDDSTTMRRIVVNALKTIGGYDIVEAGDGREALGKLDPDVGLVVTDWNMPNMGGLDFVKAVRPSRTDLAILMVTTRGTKEDILQAIEAGVDDYVLKPFTPPALKEKIDGAVAKRRP